MKSFSDENNVFYKIFFGASIVFLFFFLYFGLQMVNNQTCSTDNFVNNHAGTSKVVTTNSPHRFFLLDGHESNDYTVRSTVCMDLKGSTSDYLTINYSNTLVYVNNVTEGFTCVEEQNITDSIIFNCVTCSSTNNLTIATSNDDGLHVDGTIGIIKIPNYRIIHVEECQKVFQNVVNIYLWFIVALLFTMLLVYGIDWFGRWLSKW